MLVELSPVSYLALCGLVRDTLQVESDATPILARVAQELASATAGGLVPDDLAAFPEKVEALRAAGSLRD